MLNYNSLTAAIGLADKLEKKGFQLKAIEGTPLATLMRAGHLPNPDIGSMNMSPEERILFGTTCKNAQGVCEPDLAMDEILTVLKRTVAWNLDLAKNQVNPCIHAGVAFVEQYVSDAMMLKNTSISIAQVIYHGIWGS